MSGMIAREMAGSNVKLVPGMVTGPVSLYDEWLKWLAYESKKEKNLLCLAKSSCNELSLEEKSAVIEIQKNKEMLQLFRKYGTKSCSKEEYLKVYDYMCDNKIEDIMLEKLSSEELTAAKEKIKELAGLNLKELNSSVPNDLKSYKKMSMLDAYIFHVISKIRLLRNLKRLENEINSQIKKNEIVRRRSLKLASNPLRNK